MEQLVTEAIVPEVAELLDNFGGRLRWIHIPDSRLLLGSRGFPDYIIAGRRGILFRECKPRRSSPLRPGQTAWRYMLQAAGADWGVWAQEDLDDGTAERELEAIA
jgi:hypothetical protein